MGLAKEWQLEQQERGWYSRDGYVCQECVYDPALAAVIEANMIETSCDFCGATSDVPIAAEIDAVLEAVAGGLYFEYEDPVNQVAYDSAEGGYQMALSSTFDLLVDHEVSENDKVLDEIAFSIEHEWVQRDPYAPNPHQALTWGWDEFRTHVMHRCRFTFLLPSEDGERSRGYGEIPPEDMLGALVDAIVNAKLAKTVPAGTDYWRARPHAEAMAYSHAKDLGSPPPAAARTNRMTPAGISAFYGASTRDVAIDEVRGYAGPDTFLTVARFETSCAMTVIDLVDLPSVPSLFDAEYRHRRAAIRFLRDFAVDVARISNPDDREHLDYVPTQIVSEFLRHYYPDGRIMGLRWRSTKNAEETSTVLFLDNAACVDAVAGWQSDACDQLGMDTSSVERISPTS